MKHVFWSAIAIFAAVACASAQVRIDEEVFGKSLGGWTKRGKQAAEYPLSGSTYRTYKPEITPTPDGGLFVSVRIDHVRGWLSSDDHAVLEITVNSKGAIASAQSNIAIQGRSISSDLIRGTGEVGKQLVGADGAVQIGTDLVADLSAKLLREKIVEAGRVSFPAVLRHNYNLLFQAIRTGEPPPPAKPEEAPAAPAAPSVPAESPPVPENPANPPPAATANSSLETKPYATPGPGQPEPKK
jgi:hypothetical protein